jgi:hypothetical protein
MNDWPKGNSGEKSPLRAELSEIDSPLARLVEGLPQDRSLERLDSALNDIGRNFGELNLIKNEKQASEVFELIKALIDLDDPKATKTAAEELVRKIDE